MIKSQKLTGQQVPNVPEEPMSPIVYIVKAVDNVHLTDYLCKMSIYDELNGRKHFLKTHATAHETFGP